LTLTPPPESAISLLNAAEARKVAAGDGRTLPHAD
jgi:hypothetical protein